MPKLPRDFLSPAALAYTLTTGVMPFLDRKYQHLSPLKLLEGLQNNSVTYLKNLSLLRGTDPLYSLEGLFIRCPKRRAKCYLARH